MEEVRIGDFSRPLAEQPAEKVQESAAAATTQARLENAEQRLGAQAQAAEAKLKPHLSYEERLKEFGVTKEEAAQIVDAVLLKGHYAEDIAVTPRVRLRLRTRQHRDTQRAQNYLETARPVYESHFQDIVARYALASSLEKLGKDAFAFPGRGATGEQIEMEFKTRLSYVDTLPEPTLRLLLQKLWKFDTKVAVVLQEGVIENF